MSIEDRVINLEEFAADVRKYTQILTDIIRRHDERLDEHVETSDEVKRSIAALADAQIHTEEAQAHADTSIAALADAQARTDQRVKELIDIVKEDRNERRAEK